MGYFWRFMDGFASVASPLTTLTQKSVMIEWLEAYERSCQILKDRLISTLVLTLLEGTKGFIMYCDASRGFRMCAYETLKGNSLCF